MPSLQKCFKLVPFKAATLNNRILVMSWSDIHKNTVNQTKLVPASVLVTLYAITTVNRFSLNTYERSKIDSYIKADKEISNRRAEL